MPNIPQFINETPAVMAPQPAALDARAMGAPGAALAEGGAEISAQANEFVQRYREARRQADAANIVSDSMVKLGDAGFRWSKVPDSVAAFNGFQQEAQQLKASALAGISDPLISSYVTRHFDEQSIPLGIATRRDAFALESSTRRGQLDQRLNNYAQAAATAPDPFSQAHISDLATADIAGSVSAGWLHPEEGAQKQIIFKSQVSEVAAKRELNAALLTQDPDAAAALAQKLTDPGNFPAILPERRQALQQHVDIVSQRLSFRAASQQAHRDALAERELHRQQSDTETKLLMGVYSGQSPDLAALEDLALKRQISPGGLEAVHAAMNRQEAGRDDPLVANDLWRRLHDEDVHEDALAAFQGGHLSGKTLVELTRANSSQQKTQGEALERGAFAQLKTGLSGGAVEQGLFPDKAPEVARWAQAQGEFNNRVKLNREDPVAVASDMLQRYSSAQSPAPTWLPAPRAGAITSAADLNDVAVKTLRARESGQLDEQGYQSEVELLNQYRAFYALQSQARPTAPGKVSPGGGAKPAGAAK